MRIDQIQSEAKKMIEGDALLAPFGPVLVEDNVTDLEEPILNALEKNGVCIAIGDVASTNSDSAFAQGRAVVRASIQVFIFDNPRVHHEPAGMTLLDAVVARLIRHKDFQFENAERFQAEKGGALSVCTFAATCLVLSPNS